MKVYDHIMQAVGQTPCVRLHKVTQGLDASVYVKCEHLNPGGSIKDRIAIHMVNRAEEKGLIKPGATLIEPSSGNTGAGLAMMACLRGYKCVITMPDKMSQAKIDYLRAFGAEVIVCPTAVAPDDPRSYYSVAKRLTKEIPNSYSPNQYENQDNPEAHYMTTGPEIWEAFGHRIHTFVAGMGTGGTISGISKYLKERNPNIRTVGVDPVGSIYFDYFKTGKLNSVFKSYKVEGVGEDLLPGTMDLKLVDDVVQVGDRDSFTMARRLAREEALFVGGSAGMAVQGAIEVARKLHRGDIVVCIIPDHGDRYLATYFNDAWMKDNQFFTDPDSLKASDILARKEKRHLTCVDVQTPLTDVSAIFKANDFSQIPVLETGKVVGTIWEDKMLEHLLKYGADGTTKAGEIMGKPLPQVSQDTGVEDIFKLFRNGATAVLVDLKGSLGIISKFDLMHSLVQK